MVPILVANRAKVLPARIIRHTAFMKSKVSLETRLTVVRMGVKASLIFFIPCLHYPSFTVLFLVST
ncbi:hypothetical protein HCUR_00834 [Holospora curviuscula]|uniref:Uncharacterized protein n=1 Tax=Holospora curviuscula TaxID=1082868 RepID=A0A2S5R8P2_9PROT|nr:hypothetical protein HCUR_00834 [Holospora curviuscula]